MFYVNPENPGHGDHKHVKSDQETETVTKSICGCPDCESRRQVTNLLRKITAGIFIKAAAPMVAEAAKENMRVPAKTLRVLAFNSAEAAVRLAEEQKLTKVDEASMGIQFDKALSEVGREY